MGGVRRVLDPTLLGMLALVAGLAALAYWRGGPGLVTSGLREGMELLGRFALLLVVSFAAAGLVQVLLPQAWIRGALGAEAGLRGIVLGAGAGALVPSGPFVAIPLAAVLVRAGAAPGPVVAFVCGWGLLALHRLLAWELPILGPRLALLRWVVSLGLPVLAGLLARALTRGPVG